MSTSLSDAAAHGRADPHDLQAQADAALRVLDHIRSDTGLETYLDGLSRQLGFDYFSFVLLNGLDMDRLAGKAMIVSSYPEPWRARYERQGYHRLDAVVTVGSRQRRPFFWGSSSYLRELSAPRRRLFRPSFGASD